MRLIDLNIYCISRANQLLRIWVALLTFVKVKYGSNLYIYVTYSLYRKKALERVSGVIKLVFQIITMLTILMDF